MVLEDRDGRLLGARIASDGQWRFPEIDSVPKSFEIALLEFEDSRFYWHVGIDPLSMARAIRQNLRSRQVVSGGSTLSMQVIRLAVSGAKDRTFWRKLKEMYLAVRMECQYSKKRILRLYASHAPFGGNVVGLEAASWRYFGKSPDLLSWAESATLAVLPNSPSLIHPGKNRERLLAKRNRLLDRLFEKGAIDEWTCRLAKEEPLPDAPHPLPQLAPHLMDRIWLEQFRGRQSRQTRFQTTVSEKWQYAVTEVVRSHARSLRANEIYNLAALVIEVRTGEVLAYVGNVPQAGEEHGEAVDVIPARRSTGSILKPFLYGFALQEGLITPGSLLPDVPTSLAGYRPENFSGKFDGAVRADQALVRSLNVPLVALLQRYGLEKFHRRLSWLGLTTFDRPASYYGLPLVLGGGEGSLWQISGAYAGMARTLLEYQENGNRYRAGAFEAPTFDRNRKKRSPDWVSEAPVMSAAAIWLTFDALQDLQRPDTEGEWARFESSFPVAWKTGTSFGFRDGWAVGVTPEYVVGVWAGNADGEGRPGLVGVRTAGPVLFDILNLFPRSAWFEPPYRDLVRAPVCRQSGYRPLPICPTDTLWLPRAALEGPACSNHQWIHLDPGGQYQVNSDCADPGEMQHQAWFVLSPAEESFYRNLHPDYRPLPPYREGCLPGRGQVPLELIYPKPNTLIYVPVGLDGARSKTVFQAAHRKPETAIHWHIDAEFVGTTRVFHNLELDPPPGEHLLVLVDSDGNRIERRFTVLEKE